MQCIMKKHLLTSAVVTMFLIWVSNVICLANEDMIVIDSPDTISVDRLMTAKGVLGNEQQIRKVALEKLANSPFLDATLKSAIAASLEELPFHRIADIEISFLSGIPELIGICLEGHPDRQVAIEACAGTLILASTLSASIKYRWDLVLHQTDAGHIHQLSAGPGFGMHGYFDTGCFDTCGTGGLSVATADALGSLEYVYWIANHFGITAQLDLGASYLVYRAPNSADKANILPTGKFTVGLAF